MNKPSSKAKINYVVVCVLVGVTLIAWSAYSRIIDQEQQSMMTPDSVLQDLIEGNKRFCSDVRLKRSSVLARNRKAHEQGQFPKAVILACMDSRSIPELVFDQSIADIFTLRVAGNVVNDDMIASMEYATKYSGSKLIVIMGHTRCGAIKAACSGAGSGYLVSLVNAIKPAAETVKAETSNEHAECSDDEILKRIALQNVRNMKDIVVQKSKAIQDLLANGSIKIVGALHDIESGVVTFE